MKKNKLIIILIVLAFIVFASVVLSVSASKAKAEDSYDTYSSYLPSKSSSSSLVYEPILIAEPDSFNDLSGLDSSKITDVIITPDKEMNVTLGDTTKTLKETFNSYIKGKFIPVISLSSDTVDAFINWCNTSYFISDLMVMSAETDVLSKVYTDNKLYIYSSVYDIRSKELYSSKYDNWCYVAEANKAGANVLLIDAGQENAETASEYFEAMTKVTWEYASSESEAAASISSGSYGIVSDDENVIESALSLYSKSGYARAEYIAAHRGITAYCNENSLTSCTAAYSEGATHIEVDLQVTSDEEIVICHNSETRYNSDKTGWYFVNVPLYRLREATLNDYCDKYEETYGTLNELCEAMRYLDVIMILELKLDGASDTSVNQLSCMENIKKVLDSYPEMTGHYFFITFYEPLALKTKELMPEVPIGYLGGAQSTIEASSGTTAWSNGGGHQSQLSYAAKIKFLRYYNIGLDESYSSTSGNEYVSNITAEFYLARGFVQNTWTYEGLSNFTMKTNIATTNAAEKSALLVKTIDSSDRTISEEEYQNKVVKNVLCYSYNGWMYNYDCDMIIINEDGNTVTALLYYYQECDNSYGIYSMPVTLTIEKEL